MNQTDASFMEFGDLAGETNGGYAGEWGFQEADFTYPEVSLQEVGLSDLPGQEATEPETLFSEEEELALASELLEITTEAELDQFIGKLFRRRVIWERDRQRCKPDKFLYFFLCYMSKFF